MKIVVAGGTGLLGRAITTALLDAGHQVTATSRSNPASDPIDSRALWASADVTVPGTLPAAVQGADAVVDAVQFPNSPIENPRKGFTFERIDLGGTRNLVDAARAAGVRHFIGLSGVGASADARYHWQRFKWEEEQYIAASGVPFTVFRPSWIYGERDVSLNRFLGFTRFLPFVPVIGNGRARINPLYIGDLGAHVAAAVAKGNPTGQVFEIGGPETLTMDEVIRCALQVAGKRRFLLHNPVFVMKAVASLVQFAPGRPLTPGAIDFITMDGVADNTNLTASFGLPLTPLRDGLSRYLLKS